MSTLIKDGSHVTEIFKSSFEDFLKINAKYNELILFSLNVSDKDTIRFSCKFGNVSEYIEFVDELNTELLNNDIAIVIATDYRYDSDETTIFVVCNDR